MFTSVQKFKKVIQSCTLDLGIGQKFANTVKKVTNEQNSEY